jgi:MFS family permease
MVALAAMRLPARRPAPRIAVGRALREGLAYTLGHPGIRALLACVMLVSFVAIPYVVLMPVVAREVLGGDARTLGLLMGASGAGALAGAITLAWRHGSQGLGRLIPLSAGLFGVGLVAFAACRTLWLCVVLMMATSFAMMLSLASSNALLQSLVEDDKRGRVMSLYTMAFFGTAPIGSLIAGALADRVGAPMTLALGGVCCAVAAAAFAPRLSRLSCPPCSARVPLL